MISISALEALRRMNQKEAVPELLPDVDLQMLCCVNFT